MARNGLIAVERPGTPARIAGPPCAGRPAVVKRGKAQPAAQRYGRNAIDQIAGIPSKWVGAPP